MRGGNSRPLDSLPTLVNSTAGVGGVTGNGLGSAELDSNAEDDDP
jgi:hypothetical protein